MPTEFWQMHPEEFWWYAKAKNPEAFEVPMFDQLLDIYENGFS